MADGRDPKKGLGLALVEELLKRGAKVYAGAHDLAHLGTASRKMPKLQ